MAGFDLVFTPGKSASVLWALGGPEVRQAVEDAHHEAVSAAMEWVERHAAYTRTGHGGTAQVDATGLVCVATVDEIQRVVGPGPTAPAASPLIRCG